MDESNLPDTPLQVVSSGITAEELAAVTAVLDAAVEEELDELHSEVLIEPSAWERSQRAPRGPLHPGPGVWRSFSG
ncbi:acyl-CoA carboxylase subunit epsilon [Herbiconiux sp. CPCC 203407]|uniref:Acyl-CoA carboxylase subunit epsilon n=1 Tax=Herbiconiux oxytropis TaxID=2970915 RepID=A0AA42BSQ8_9MICO|nr:acyl-CoA carboxylase subunit epsilon [Herbiconiux oxytropis]MCS5721987.1 acyl-CoA carboxylase subunit epsilon [Herbiconiux oxytropis]MCS5725570.1 acyl-CoA carboxylase subunit epsilon [Herbiconiux oxytropis]